jgi:holo-[acyl-carrier protein] synthase
MSTSSAIGASSYLPSATPPIERGPASAYAYTMPIVGHGIDIVETARIKNMVQEHGQRFLDRCFTPAEQAYCANSPKRYFEHLAGRFAAKEAVLKVIGTGWRGGIAWTDIEIIKESSGQPRIALTGETARIAKELGIAHWHVSLSHIETHATASAIGLREE